MPVPLDAAPAQPVPPGKRCAACKYELCGLAPHGTCPECGRVYPPFMLLYEAAWPTLLRIGWPLSFGPIFMVLSGFNIGGLFGGIILTGLIELIHLPLVIRHLRQSNHDVGRDRSFTAHLNQRAAAAALIFVILNALAMCVTLAGIVLLVIAIATCNGFH